MAENDHLSVEQLRSLVRGEAPERRLLRRALHHLLARCPECRTQWNRFRGEREQTAGEDPGRFDGPVQRALGRLPQLSRRVARERQEAQTALEELLALPEHAARVRRLRRSARFRNWALCEALLRRARQSCFVRPEDAEETAELALEACLALEDDVPAAGALGDLLARGWALLANARRVVSDLGRAEETFLMARFFLQQGSGDPLVIAEVMDLEASLRRDQRRLDDAARLLREVIAVYRKAGEATLEGRAWLSLSTVLGEGSQVVEALEAAGRGAALIDPREHPRLGLCVRHARVRLLVMAGRSEQARRTLERLRPSYRAFPEATIQLRLRWVEGEIAEGLGEAEEAERAYRAVRAGFLEIGIGFDAALACLNLAALLVQQGRTAELKELAREMVTLFEARDVHREATAALALFQQAALAEAATLETVLKISRYLESARRNPSLKLEEPS